MVGRNLKDSDMGQHIVLLARHQALFLVQDSTHILVGAQQTLHQEVSLTRVDQLDSLCTGLVVVGFLHQLEFVGVDTFLGADLLDGLDVANESSVDNTLVDSHTYGSDGVRIIGVSNSQSFFTFCFYQLQELFQLCNHIVFSLLL